jgi:hypothetical protein
MRIRQRLRGACLLAFLLAWIFPTIIAFLPSTLKNNQIINRGPTFRPSVAILYYELSGEGSDVTSSRPPPRKPQKQKQPIRRKHWDEMLPRLQAFREKNGHAKVTRDDGDGELYEWVRNLRYNYLFQVRNLNSTTTTKAGKHRSRLSDKKLQALQALDFCWETSRKWNRWDLMFERLQTFKAEQDGRTLVTKDDGDAELYEWTKSIRYNYRHQALNHTTTTSNTNSYRRPRLSAAKFEALQQMNFDWQVTRKVNRWDEMLPRLKAFQNKHGHTMVTLTEEHGADMELYQWTQNLIRNYGAQLLNTTTVRNGPRLSQEKVKILQQMAFSWVTRSSMWDRRHQELRDFSKQYGHCHVSTREYPQLGVFVQNQRQEYRRYLAGNTTTLTAERIQALQLINFEWARSQERGWEERRDDVKDYLERTGNANVPQDYANNLPLGQWCMNQRTNYRLKTAGEQTGLTQDRISKLETVDFLWSARQVRWNNMFDRLKEYQEENGHLGIETADNDNGDLRQWLNEQRHFYKTKQTSRLNPERIEGLESIPEFSWRRRRGDGPSKEDWSQLFVAIREKGISPVGQAKQHWFEDVDRSQDVKTEWTDQELGALWNEENDDGEEEDEDEYYEDESRLFLRA